MASQVLIDTNIFLEVLLEQQRSKLCEEILRQHNHRSALTDFALHSIGIALLGKNRSTLFDAFVSDVLVRNELVRLPESEYSRVSELHRRHRLGFDDAYHLAIAETIGLELITLDHHFEGIESSTQITR
jgi:predicted nucleic acid-binding protein